MKSLTDPTNRDTEPAMLTEGEFVSTKETMEIYGPTLVAQNNHGLALRAARNKAFLQGKPIPKMVPPPEMMNSGGIVLSDKDKDLLIRMAAAEARGEDPEGQAAVMYVVLNRQKANREEFSGDKIEDIINHPNAFTSTVDENKGYYKLDDTDIPKSAEYKKAKGILNDILSGKMKDPTGGAEHFLNPDNLDEYPKWWREGTHNRKRIGRHVFALNNKIHNLKTPPPKVRKIPGYNNGGIPMEDDDNIMNFIMNYQGKLGDVNPEDVAAGIISDEDLLQNSSDAGANSFEEAGRQQYNNPRLSIPIPGLAAGMTDSAQLRGGVVRPDMMPPGYVPTAPEVMPRSTSPQGGADRIALNNITSNLDLQVPRSGGLMNAVVPPAYAGYDASADPSQMLSQFLAMRNNPDMFNRMNSSEQQRLITRIDELQSQVNADNKQPFFDLSSAYDADGNEIMEDGENVPPTINKFARQNIEAQITLAEKSRQEGERILKLASSEKDRLKAIAIIEKANSDIERYNAILNKDNESYKTIGNIIDKNSLRNSELELAKLRKELNNAGNPLHIAQLNELIPELETSIDEQKKALNDDKTTDDKKVEETTKVLTSKVPIGRKLEEAIKSGAVEKAGSKVKQGSPQWEGAKSFLKDIFGDIFNKKDLVRAITIYLGARIFGASGNQAGAMAGKYYLGKQDQHEATVAAYMKAGKHKPSSIAKYAKTRNLNDLELIGTSVTPTNTYETFYKRLPGGKELKVMARKYKIGEDGSGWKIQIADPDNPGKRIWVAFDPTQGFTTDGSRFRSGGDKYTKEVARLQELGAKLVKPELSVVDDDGVEKRIFENFNEQKAGLQWGNWTIDNDIPADTSADMLNMAVQMMKQEKKKDPDKKAGYGSIKPYLDQTYVTVVTEGTGVSGVAFKNAEGDYIPTGDLKIAISNVRQTAIKANPDLANYNSVMMDTMIVANANKNYQIYLDRILLNKPDDMSELDFLNKNDKFRISAQSMKPQTTPLYEFMRAGGINAT